jgi:hypothetical protein
MWPDRESLVKRYGLPGSADGDGRRTGLFGLPTLLLVLR